MRYFLHLAYRGTSYHGWQKQLNTNLSIQQIIEDRLQSMTGENISLMGCGRTDTGVHAMQYFAHFDYEKEWVYDPIERLNRMLPDDISVYELIAVDKRAHSRYDATERSYEYHLHLERNPYLAPFSTYVLQKEYNYGLIRDGLQILLQTKDFRHLCLTPHKFKNTFCTLSVAMVEISEDGKRMCFRFTANRFLKSMIRIIVARLLALGEGKISLEEFSDTSKGNQSFKFRPLAYPQGLHLKKIVYPYMEKDVKASFLLR